MPFIVRSFPFDPVSFPQSDERAKFDGIFESLGPVKGLLSGDKVKPVLMNSKLPLDALGRVSTSSTPFISIIDHNNRSDCGDIGLRLSNEIRASLGAGIIFAGIALFNVKEWQLKTSVI